MKFLNIFNHYLDRGGEAYAVERITESLAREHEVKNCEFWSADWITPTESPQWKQALWMVYNPRSIKKLRDLHASFRPDCWLIHNVLPVGSLGIYLQAKKLGVPVIQYLHNFRPFSVNGQLWANGRLAPGGLSRNYWQEVRHGAWQDSHLKTGWLAFVLFIGHVFQFWKGVTIWIAISEFMRQKFITAGVPADDIVTLRHFWSARANCSVAADGGHYLYLGRLTAAKGVMTLLDTWEILERKCGTATPHLVIGGEGPLRSLVLERARRTTYVHFGGPLEGNAKVSALTECRAVIVPSLWWEPLGLVVYEAYEYCKPVLASSSGGLPEIVLDQKTGFLHDPGDPVQLANQVLELERDGSLRNEMGRQGRVWLEENANEREWRARFSNIAAHAQQSRSRN